MHLKQAGSSLTKLFLEDPGELTISMPLGDRRCDGRLFGLAEDNPENHPTLKLIQSAIFARAAKMTCYREKVIFEPKTRCTQGLATAALQNRCVAYFSVRGLGSGLFSEHILARCATLVARSRGRLAASSPLPARLFAAPSSPPHPPHPASPPLSPCPDLSLSQFNHQSPDRRTHP